MLNELGGSRIITRAEGCTIYDGDGAALLDGMAGLWCVNVGYGREEMARAAYDQMLELPFYNTFFKTATPPTIVLAAKIAEKLGGELQHVFFNSSGSEANDTVYRMVRTYWALDGPAATQDLHLAPQCLSRLDRCGRQPGRDEADARAGRTANSRHRTRDAALSLWRSFRRG